MDISVIIPAFNEEKNLPHTIKAIRASCTRARLKCEVIVVDNNSTDKTAKVAKKLADSVLFENQQGISHARNYGARRAKGKILIFLDADTSVPRELVTTFFRAFKKGKAMESSMNSYMAKVVCVGCRVMPHPLNVFQRAFFNLLNWIIYLSVKINRPSIAGNCVAYRRDAFFKAKGFREDLIVSEDQDLCFRISKYGKVVFIANLTVETSSRRIKKLGFPYLVWEWFWTSLHFVLGIKATKYKITR